MKFVSAHFPQSTARAVRPLLIAILVCLLGAGGPLPVFAQPATATRPNPRADYRVYWTAIRASDNAPLLSVSSLAVLGRTSEAATDAPPPAENRPAIILVSASLSSTGKPGALNLLTFVKVREANPNKKGKLKITKRNLRALVPIRIGETQIVSSTGDSIRLEVRIEPVEPRN